MELKRHGAANTSITTQLHAATTAVRRRTGYGFYVAGLQPASDVMWSIEGVVA